MNMDILNERVLRFRNNLRDVSWDGLREDLIENLKTDLRLRNLTIYAQWASISAAILLYIPIVFNLYCYIVMLSNVLSGDEDWDWDWKWVLIVTLFYGPILLFYPYAPLALELQHHIEQKGILFASMLSWWVPPIRNYIAAFSYHDPFREDATPESIFAMYIFFNFFSQAPPLFLLPIHCLVGKGRLAHSGTGIRFSFNFLYWIQLAVGPFFTHFVPFDLGSGWLRAYVVLIYWVATWLFGIAALLYLIAKAKRHLWVSSKLLGGTAIESMQLMLPGGPSHQSVGDESREGAIRLV